MANPAIASLLQSERLVGRVAERGSLATSHAHMTPTQNEIEEFQSLEREAEALLAEIAASSQLTPRDSLHTLERIAARAAKIAYGTGSPDIVSEQMRHLIAWTDHLEDESWCARFQQTLRTRPLISSYGNAA